MTLPHRPLGHTGLRVSSLSFGVSGPLGGAAVSAAGVERLIRAAVEAGVTSFDTAPFYGDAERRLGRALRGAADVVITTKAGKRRRGLKLERAETPDEIIASLEASRAALGRDRIDVLLLHGPSAAALTETLRDRLEDARRRGWIRAYGATARMDAVDLRARGFGEVLQVPAESADAADLKGAGAALIGIEAMRRATTGVRASLAPADLWYTARALRDRAAPSGEDPIHVLERALRNPSFASIVMTTTRVAHLCANAEAARRVGL